MPRFDWKRFLTQHKIEFVTSGPNYSKRNLCNIQCPFCGESDHSQHLGIGKNGWGCLRNASHRGKSNARLVQQLLRCSGEEARRIVGVSEDLAPTTDELSTSFAALQNQLGLGQPAKYNTALALPKEFKPLLNGSPFATPFVEYLSNRGYREAQIKWLAENYKLHYATTGSFAWRVILPVYDRYGTLQTWTARAIQKDVQPRYKTLTVEAKEGEPEAKIAINNTILGLQVLHSVVNGRSLVIVEGPFDALKLTAFGHSVGLYATSLFGLNVYPEQVSLLQEVASRFERVYLLIDEDAELHRLRLLERLSGLAVTPLKMPLGADDPGEMTGAQVVELAYKLAA